MTLNKAALLAAAGAAAVLGMTGAAAAADARKSLARAESAVVSDGAELARAKRADARSSLAAALQSRGASRGATDAIVETARFKDANGVEHARFEQRIGGLRVYGSYAKTAIGADGAPRALIARIARNPNAPARAVVTEADALRAALDLNFKGTAAPGLARKAGAIAEFAKTPFFQNAPTVERVIIGEDLLEEGFLVETWSAKDNLLYHTLIDATGAVVDNELRTAEDNYNIFADHPGVSAQTIVAGPGAGNAQSPSGWLSGAQSSILIQGNNVRAYLDRNNNNAPDTGGVSITDGNFVTVASLSSAPTTTGNQAVAVQNLFYLNNVIHDALRSYGFVEGAGNFQENNFGLGGLGSDSVDAEAQDGGGTNNANFATPADGSNPRMQMYLWTATTPNRDGDLDSDIVWHEYGHGLTWRMIGSMSGNVPGAIGEGMGDVLAIIHNDQDAVGEYSYNRAAGIRSSVYSTHPDTIGDFAATRGVHRNGEIIAATIWDMWTRYKAAGHNTATIMGDIVGGMNFIPAAPNYFQMRDGFLAQAPAGRDCLIWEAFAARGMGAGGSMNSTGSSITESFSLPTECGGTPPPSGPRLTNLTGVGTSQNASRWRATMTATVDNGAGAPQSGVVVIISTSTGTTGSCTTSTSGTCSASLSNLRKTSVASVTFTVTGLNGNTSASGVPRSVVVNRP